jgi:hypothetical protein
MNPIVFEFLAADRAAQLLREAEAERLAQMASAQGDQGGGRLASLIGQRPARPERRAAAGPVAGS